MAVNPIVAQQIAALTPEQKQAIKQELVKNPSLANNDLIAAIDGSSSNPPMLMPISTQPIAPVNNVPSMLNPAVAVNPAQPVVQSNTTVSPTVFPVNNSQPGSFLKTGGKILGGIGNLAEGALLGLQGKPFSEHSMFKKKPEEDFAKLLKEEQLKNAVDPTKITAQKKLDEINRKGQEENNVDISQGNISVEDSQSNKGPEKPPPLFIPDPRGRDEFGHVQYIDNPDRKLFDDIKKEERSIDLVAKKAAEKDRQVNISKISRLNNITDIIEKEYEKTKTPGGMTGFLRRPAETFSRNLQITDNQRQDKAYGDFAKGMRVQLARAMSEVGNLSEPEQKAALDLIPNLLDDPRTAKIKLQQLRDLVNTVKDNSSNNDSNNIPSVGQTFNGEKVLGVKKIK